MGICHVVIVMGNVVGGRCWEDKSTLELASGVSAIVGTEES